MKTVLITGCSRGIGRAVSEFLAENGYRVIGTSTSGKGGARKVEMHKLNFIENGAVQKLMSGISEIKFDILINNAAVLLEQWNDPEVRMDELKKTFDVNVFGLIELTETMIPQINEGGHIINFSSGWGAVCSTNVDEFVPHYKLSKASVNMYSRLLANRLKGNIKVSVIDPGWVRTEMGGSNATRDPHLVGPEIIYLLEKNVPSGRFWRGGKERSW